MILRLVGNLNPCFLLSYVLPSTLLSPLVPEGLELQVLDDYAFANLVVCRIEALRPARIPSVLGVSYWHAALRLHVKASVEGPEDLEGLYFVKSLVEGGLIAAAGNKLTDFKMVPARFLAPELDGRLHLEIKDHASLVLTARDSTPTAVPVPFRSQEHMEQFLKYSPFGLDATEDSAHIRVTEVHRDEAGWQESPIDVKMARWQDPAFRILSRGVLARSTSVAPIEYVWQLGRTERTAVSA